VADGRQPDVPPAGARGSYTTGHVLGNLNIEGGNGQGDALYMNLAREFHFGGLNISGIEIRN
jgi:hypothetical protein